MKYTVSGFDLYGNPVSETIDYVPPTWRQRLSVWLFVRLPRNWGYRLGLTKFRHIDGIRDAPDVAL